MASGNGDERQAAAWERVEAKLDRLAERQGAFEQRVEARFDRVEATLLQHGARLDTVERTLLRQGETLKAHSETLKAHSQLLNTHAEVLTSLVRALDATRREIEAKLDRLREELLGSYGESVRRDLIAAQTMNETKLADLERRVRALEGAG